jgi:hypothetical protein
MHGQSDIYLILKKGIGKLFFGLIDEISYFVAYIAEKIDNHPIIAGFIVTSLICSLLKYIICLFD